MRKQYQEDYELRGIRNGKKTYHYAGKWYRISLETKAYRKFWLTQLLFALALLGIQLAAGFLPTLSLYTIYAALPFGACFILLLFFLLEAIFCPFHPDKMERIQYDQQYGRLRKLAFVACILFPISFVTNLIALILQSSFTAQSFLQLALLLLLSILAVLLYRIEKKLPVETEDDNP
ncbi:hypothetical protein [Hominifimenecus sp. rT4P-3]|uniref:hypothetical protein n=1 Tax=Hominifimenecus sp. rT4P-3 TaxID=3242979 RepID=UPI003DA6257D